MESLPLGSEMQADLWLDLCGKWQDDSSVEESIEEIRSRRSAGREVTL